MQGAGSPRGSRRLRQLDDGVALAGEPLVELHHRPAEAGAHPLQLAQGPLHLLLGAEILEARRERHPGLAEHLAAAGLGAVVAEARVEAVHRDAEQHRELPLQWRAVEHGQVGAARIEDRGADALHEPRPLEDLLGERTGRAVVRREDGEAGPRVARGHAGEELEVVLQQHRVHRLRGDVDHPGARVAQPDEQEEQPLLVERGSGELLQLPRSSVIEGTTTEV